MTQRILESVLQPLLVFACIWPLLGSAQTQRVVVFHPVFLQDLLSLGVIPVAGHKSADLSRFLDAEQLGGITNLALPTNPEQLAEVHADLFITPKLSPFELRLYRQLAPITQIGGFSTGYDWRKRHREVAAALGMAERAEFALREYDRRAADVRAELAHAGLHPKVLMAYVHEDRISVFGHKTNGVRVLEDAGLEHCPATDPSNTVAVSYERLRVLDCDALFIVPAAYATQAAVDAIAHQIELLNRQPLWSSLRVVRRHHVYFEDKGYWQNTSPLGADMVLQEIEEIFLNKHRPALHAPAPIGPNSP